MTSSGKGRPYYAASFAAGFCLMAVEIVSSRIVAPIIGSSLYTWTAVIGVTLLGLSLGSVLGGILADRYLPLFGRKVLAYAALGCAALVYAMVPLSKNLGFIFSFSTSLPPLSLLISAVLFLLPALAIGTLSPLIFKLYVSDLQDIGTKYGQLSGIWSLGSIAGVFVTGYYFIQSLGTARTVSVVAVLLLALFFYFFTSDMRRSMDARRDALILGAVLLAALLIGTFSWGRAAKAADNILFEKDTAYYAVKVVDHDLYPRYGKNRMLFLDVDMHSIQTEKPSHEFYTDIAPAFSALSSTINNIYVIGAGAYTLPSNLRRQYPKASIDVLEIDPEIEKVGRQFFNSNDYALHTIVGDARVFFRDQPTAHTKRYDLIYGDAYNSFVSVPWYLLTKESIAETKRYLNPGGMYAINFISALEGQDAALFRSVRRTMAESFRNNYVFAFGKDAEKIQNITIVGVASDVRIPDDVISGRLQSIDQTHFLAQAFAANAVVQKQDINKGTLLTDDFAPVESMMSGLMKDYFPKYIALYHDILS